jgi:hypothetical protein
LPATFINQILTLLTAMGEAVSGGQIWICTQPANVGSLPPSPLATIYSDNAGANPVTQPLTTGGQGQTSFYAAPGVYTYVFFSPHTGQINQVDQTLVSSATPAVTQVVPTGSVNGSNTVFTLPSTPTNYLNLYVNGVLQLPTTNYTISGPTITMVTAPFTGYELWAVYQ